MSSKVKKAQKQSSSYSVGVTDINVVETTFKWVVNNFSFYRNGFKNKLNSPVFETTNNKTITWCMELDPNTSKKFNNLNLNLKLVQSSLPKVHANFEFMIINKNGEPEKSTLTKSATFHIGSSKSSKILMSHGYFEKHIQRILPNDKLTILCKIKTNLDQGSTNTMKTNADGPPQKIQAKLNNLAEATAKMDIDDLPKMNSETTTAAVAVVKKANTVGSKQKIQAELNKLTEATAKMDIGGLPKLYSETITATVASTTMPTNVAGNVYPPLNFACVYMPPSPNYQPGTASFANTSTNVAANACSPPYNVACSLPTTSYQSGIAPFTSTGIQYKSCIGSSGNSAAPPLNSSTPSRCCRYCNHLLHNCQCNRCKYCKLPSQKCKCIHCKICKLHVIKCTCLRCENCDDLIKDCKCEYCSNCDSHMDECYCEICDYCDNYMEECECPHCPDCDLHIEDCDCDENYCPYCDEHREYCDCDYCPDCDFPNDDCECNEFGNNPFYY